MVRVPVLWVLVLLLRVFPGWFGFVVVRVPVLSVLLFLVWVALGLSWVSRLVRLFWGHFVSAPAAPRAVNAFPAPPMLKDLPRRLCADCVCVPVLSVLLFLVGFGVIARLAPVCRRVSAPASPRAVNAFPAPPVLGDLLRRLVRRLRLLVALGLSSVWGPCFLPPMFSVWWVSAFFSNHQTSSVETVSFFFAFLG